MTHLRNLHQFISDVLDRRRDPGGISDQDKPPFTYESFAEALSNVFNLFSADLLEIEKKLKSREETFTLLTFFKEISPWMKIFDSLGTFFSSAIAKNDKKTNWEKSILLLANLDLAVNSACHDAKLFTILVDLFLKSMAPYFRIIGVWLTQGRLEDFRSEFVYGVHENVAACKIDPEEDVIDGQKISYISTPNETFWTEGFIIRPFEKILAKNGLKAPKIFQSTFARILTCGKSITILTLLEKQNVIDPSYKECDQPQETPEDLFDKFLTNLKSDLIIHKRNKGLQTKVKTIPMVTEGLSLSDILGDISEYDKDLVAAYDIIAADLPEDLEANHDAIELENEEEVLIDPERFLILSDYGLDPMSPMTSVLEDAFVPVVHSHTSRACSRLVNLFQETLNLEKDLIYLRRVFFMEAGDLLSEFYTTLFNNLDTNPAECDDLSLSILLHDCLCRRFITDDVEKFNLSMDISTKEPLTTINLNYSVKWPLNIVLHSKALDMYNKVFKFLLGVKHSLWALLQIDPKDLDETIKDDNEDHQMILHRVILLRSWLLHFISNVHDYFMTRVLQSTQAELHSCLMECHDLDAILKVHNGYIQKIYDRCFLHPSASILKEAVIKVLKSAVILYKYCKSHLENPSQEYFIMKEDTLRSLEENYAKRHQFLASTLKSMTQKRNVIHLEGLAAALLHSFPTIVSS